MGLLTPLTPSRRGRKKKPPTAPSSSSTSDTATKKTTTKRPKKTEAEKWERNLYFTVRVHDNPMHQDMYSQWKMLQWDPPEFARAPGGPVSNVAIAHVRLGGEGGGYGESWG
ncbi:HEXOKINASE FAMILY MEMBER [Salix purpurea]|uniref:HEXOKINASE FAMILY MEMBER n=1 Tax=Salix purpurea TaxID=77065 RepID=A0A9Q0VW42_SALPP|nr:HEXOKINASE FAMILY MEMBER [Salix purpurea]